MSCAEMYLIRAVEKKNSDHPVQKCKQQIAPADFALCLLSAHPFGSAATRWYTAKIYQWQHDGKPVANLHSRADKPINRFL